MKILFLSAEVAPFASVGGLSQVLYFLPKSLSAQGIDTRIFTAKHGTMEKTNPANKPWNTKIEVPKLEVSVDHSFAKTVDANSSTTPLIQCSISSISKKGTPKVYFLENREYFELRANVFSYKDDHVRFALLSKAALEWLLKLKKDGDWWPDIIHCNDWHTGYFIDLARRDPKYNKILFNTPIVFTIHNFFYQGNMNFSYLPVAKRDDGLKQLAPLNSGKLIFQNALLRGIINADEINTVSPTHAIEVLTPEYAAGLDGILGKTRGKLTGILNGLDTREFDPSRDPIIRNNYTKKNFITARKKNKIALQKDFNLQQDVKKPLIAIVGRISAQKGWELILHALPKLLDEKHDLQIIVMGQGDQYYQNELIKLAKKFPNQLALHLQTDFRIPRRIYSSVDMVLMPSIFEPGGIVALEALRYGAVPIVRRTGGLNDIITEFDTNKKIGNGFSFIKKDSWSLFAAIVRALTIYEQKDIWKTLVTNCLDSDFSWDYSAREYIKWYKRVIEERKRAGSLTPHPAYTTIKDVDFR